MVGTETSKTNDQDLRITLKIYYLPLSDDGMSVPLPLMYTCSIHVTKDFKKFSSQFAQMQINIVKIKITFKPTRFINLILYC